MIIDIYDFQTKIETRKDFEKFLKLFVEDFNNNKKEWDNDTLPLFLESLYGYNFDSENDPKEIKPTWKVFAEMLLAAKVYE